MNKYNFSEETTKWLGEWLSQTGNDMDEMTNSLTIDSYNEL
uniref:Uncharacterized protein n=1 Tax=Pithovirus LCDPAC02 TaxID=2506601 RepID=A0A481YPK7_9VIRU|nr:MAG: hypothetical protein LCDPAC02_02380 [Pithovirus LCDPAC02]